MRKLSCTLTFVVLFALQGFPQEHYTEGPVWQVSLIRVNPGHMDDYLTAFRRNIKPFWDDAKREGAVMDWKLFLKQTKESPKDWDIALVAIFKNHAQMDGVTAKFEAIRDKTMGGKAAAQEANLKRGEIREVVSIELLREIMLK